jgi:hypothetical protein
MSQKKKKKKSLYNDKENPKTGGSDDGQILIRLNMIVVYGVQRHIHQYFRYITTVSFIGGGKQSTRRNHPLVASNLVRLNREVVAVIVRLDNISVIYETEHNVRKTRDTEMDECVNCQRNTKRGGYVDRIGKYCLLINTLKMGGVIMGRF